MIEVICYTGGTCGDLISALIDPAGVEFSHSMVMHLEDRRRLKKPHMFDSDLDKDNYMKYVNEKYLSIPSHDLDYHVRRNHTFVGITVKDRNIATKAATRFKKLHRDEVWASMSKACGAQTIDDYAQILLDYSNMVKQHTDRTIQLERIFNGDAVRCLEELGINNCKEHIYKNWLDIQKGTLI
jgi:hypothetical protein